MSVDRNEFLRGAMAAGAASFAQRIAPDAPSGSTAIALDHVQRLVDAASDRLRGALADASADDPTVGAALLRIKGRAQAIVAQVDEALPLG